MTDYTKTAQRADASLRRKGGPVTLRRTTTGDYDPETGAAPTQDVDYLGTGVKLDYDINLVDGTLIQRGDQMLLLSPLQTNGQPMPLPEPTDVVLIGAKVYHIITPTILAPVDVAVLFTMQLRG